MSPRAPAVELDSAVLDLGGHRVLDGISLSVAEGEKVVLFGPSGGGKSSLLRSILGLERLSAGTVRVLGNDITRGEKRALSSARRQTAAIFQHFNLFTMKTVLDNVALGARQIAGLSQAEARSLAAGVLDRVGVGRLAGQYPFQLSGGEQQRVAIARALATHPKLLLLDEPTSALDPELVKGVLLLIEEIVAASNLTVVCVTHELGFARRLADRAVFLAAGRIVEEGLPADLLDRPGSERLRAFLRTRRYGLPAGADAELRG
jgi:ABC-type polar amino acid transport system ATPase subunit